MAMSNNMGQFGDTTLTKVFVGGLAWETPKEAMRDHFEKYGEILEAVIISDKITGRSKGYGFVTFKDSEAAKKACEDSTPIINGRRTNCNLASRGARRLRSASIMSMPPPPPPPPPPLQQGSNVNVGPRSVSSAPAGQMQWNYPARTPSSPFHHQQNQAVPFYGYSPSYIATDINYNQKLSYNGRSFMNGHYSHVYQGQPVVGAIASALMPMYPLHNFHHHHHHHHQSQSMGLPSHIYSPTSPGPMATVPVLISKPTSMGPKTVYLAVE